MIPLPIRVAMVNHTTVAGRKTGTVPHIPEENVIVQFGKLGSKITQCSATCCLSYFFLCHNNMRISD